jgi:hypothetical protein
VLQTVPKLALLAALLGIGSAAPARAGDLGGDDGQERPTDLSVSGGLVAVTLAANAELQTRWGPAVGLGAGGRRGPAINAYVGEALPLSAHWSLRPGFRFVRWWQTVEGCPGTCTFDAFLAEVGLRYRGPSGFLFELGLPIVGWLPVGPAAGQTEPHLQFYTLATGDLALFQTLLFGYAFDP